MRRMAVLLPILLPIVLPIVGMLACGGKARPSLPAPETAPHQPWDDLERICARDDDPPHLERVFVGEDQREQLVVPVGIEPALGISRSWFALGEEDPGLAPFEWSWLMVELDEPEARHEMGVGVELVSPGAVRVSTPAWQVPGRAVAVHLELSSATSTACGQLLVEVPPAGQPRRWFIPTTPTRL